MMNATKLFWRCPFHQTNVLARLNAVAATMHYSASAGATKLKELGTFEQSKPTSSVYNSGQLFLHKVFAYRGVVLCSAPCKVYEKPKGGNKSIEQSGDGSLVTSSTSGREVQPNGVPYYQVLIHKGDWDIMRFPSDMTTYILESPEGPQWAALNGVDYVSHEDVLPYSSCESEPIEHDLFQKFVQVAPQVSEDGFVRLTGTELLRTWMNNNRVWLTPVEVHRKTTEGVRITAMSFYLGTIVKPDRSVMHVWRYNIRIENFNPTMVILRERCWKVFSLTGNMQTYQGVGVVGFCPVLSSQQPAFQYSSHIQLESPKGGHMWGTFKMERQNGTFFDAEIPSFVLDGKRDLPNP
uniref:ApaG domain-containing protein n=1 Tax=Plectus sambesii TaxID=2011161 RepID=A0A914UY33_9BILA